MKVVSKGIVLKTDGTIEDIEVTHFSDVQLAVGGIMETVIESTSESTYGLGKWAIYGNEIGRVCSPPLPENQIARWLVSVASGGSIDDVLTMHGNFVVLGIGDDGEWMSLDPMVAVVSRIASDLFADLMYKRARIGELSETLRASGHPSLEQFCVPHEAPDV